MDPIQAVTDITRQVMKRLLGLDDSSSEPREIHVHVHVHSDGKTSETKAQFPFRYRGKP